MLECWVIANWTLRNKLQWNFNQDTKLFINENAYENIICKMPSLPLVSQVLDIYDSCHPQTNHRGIFYFPLKPHVIACDRVDSNREDYFWPGEYVMAFGAKHFRGPW